MIPNWCFQVLITVILPHARGEIIRPYPLLESTPPSCQDLLYGKKFGAPYGGAVLTGFERLMAARYDVTVHGLDEILARGDRGLVLAPNHEGSIDPLVMIKTVGRRLALRPVMTETMMRGAFQPIMKLGMDHLNGFLLPDPASGGQTAIGRAEALFREIGNAVKHGDNVLIYPSGTLQIGPNERLGSKRAVHMMLKENPDLRLILVRERGLWGSSWTHGGPEADPERRAETGEIIARGMKRGAKVLIRNLGGEIPKRPVSLTFFEPTDFPRTGTVQEMNEYLERFYNAEPEQRTLVSNYHWDWPPHVTKSDQVIDYARAAEPTDAPSAASEAKPETIKTVVRLARTELLLNEVDAQTNLLEHIDSLSKANLIVAVEQNLNVTVPDDAQFSTVGNLAKIVDDLGNNPATNQPAGPRFKPSPGWQKNPAGDARVRVFAGETLAAKIVARGLAEPNKVISEDLNRAMTYRGLLLQSLAIAKTLESLPGERLGLLVPASFAGPLFFMASHLAGKVPVMVNFTSPPEAIVASLDSVGVEKILTSRVVVDRLGKAYDLSKYMHRFVYVEDLKTKIIAALPGAWARLKFAPKSVIKRASRTSDAVILFTSGSSGTPKAVPLTHANILANVNDVVERFHIHESDRLLCFLPPFHSFGNLLQILSLTLGVPTVYHANPQEARTIAALIGAFGATIVVATPTLGEEVARQGTPEKLKSTRLFVAGAEALPQKTHDFIQSKFTNAAIVEGYGTTEMSPVVAANPPEDPRPGTVGLVVPSLKYKVANPETFEEVAPGELGTLLVTGPSMFRGYLNTDVDPFVTMPDGLRYYDTGDLVRDRDGYIKIEGRQSRYRKIKGEMVSLPELENAVNDLAEPRRPRGDDGQPVSGPLVVVESKGDNEPLVLFTAVDLSFNEVQAHMKERKFGGVRTLSEVRQIDAIPMLGTGKADYKKLQRMLE